MSKASVTQTIIDNVYDNTDNEVTGGMVQTAMIAIVNDEYTALATKQDKLVSGTNIKTVGGTSLLGSGNIALSAGTVGAYSKTEIDSLLNTKVAKTTTVNGKALSGNITLAAADVSALPSTTTYAGSSTVGGAATSANKVNSTLTIQQNGTSAGTFNGSAATTINITPTGIGAYTKAQVDTALAAKQATLVSGTNIKTINGVTLLGTGDIALSTSGSYLPLAGGTLTGALNGTTATLTGNVTALGFYQSSDKRFKKNIKNIEAYDIIDKVDNIKFKSFDWIKDNKEDIGVIAQDVEQYLPELINVNEDGYLSVNYVKLLIMKNIVMEKKIDDLQNILNKLIVRLYGNQ
ncbi:MAG: tail fiber domain-containing protein [Prevotella sp.]|jgi:hypothetical protein|nr:tail fiber domain-containing protein [Prevotella sp.]